MPFKGGDFQWSREEAYANVTYDKYGEENTDAMCELVAVENGARKYWADKLRELVDTDKAHRPKWAAAMREAADLLDPYSGNDVDGRFARTTLDDRPEGAKWVKP